MANVEFEGKDLEEAIAQAAEALNLPPEEVKFTLLAMGAKGFLGLGRKKAKISVDPSDPSLREEAGQPAKKAAGQARAASSTEPSQEVSSSGRGEKARRPVPRKDTPERAARSENRPTEPARAAEPLPLDWAHVSPPLSWPGPGEVCRENPTDPEAELAAQVLRDMLGHLGFSADLSCRRIGSRIVMSLDGGEDNALLIGTRGATLEALQLLTAKLVSKKLKESSAVNETDLRVVLDVADYRLRRHQHLLEVLGHLAAEVRRSRKPQTINGLSSAERRLIQMALRPFKDLTVMSGVGRDALLIGSASAPPPRPHQKRRGRSAGFPRKN